MKRNSNLIFEYPKPENLWQGSYENTIDAYNKITTIRVQTP